MVSKARQQLERARAAHRRKVDDDYRRRHPDRAAEERAFRKARALREQNHDRRDRLKDGGTPETRAKAAVVRQGALARMVEKGQLSIDQLAAAQQIRSIAERIGADVAIGTVSQETRVDSSPHYGGAFFERLGAVRAEVAYSQWRATLANPAPVLAMIVDEVPVTTAAAHYRMRKETARRMLTAALDLWSEMLGRACDEIDEATLLAAQAGIL